MSLPRITETQIQRLATPRTYARGEGYYREKRILRPVRQGNILSALCIGTDSYEVEIAFDDSGISECNCSCPYDRGGICKHSVALLLTWCRKPETFEEIPTLQEVLERQSKDELIALFEIMVNREPR